jgi:hypothetical protein
MSISVSEMLKPERARDAVFQVLSCTRQYVAMRVVPLIQHLL